MYIFPTFSSICDFTADFSKRSFSNSDVSLSIICKCNNEHKSTDANKPEQCLLRSRPPFRQFSTTFKHKNQKLKLIPSPLSEGKMQQILTERYSGKTKQITNWSVSTFKGKLKFFRFKIVKYKTRAFNRKIEIKPILLNISLTANNHF